MGTEHDAHRGMSSGGHAKPAIVLAGRIVDVDPLRWTCRIRTEEGGPDNSRTLYDVPIGGTYLHPAAGEGSFVMPEIGALVHVCRPSEGDAPPFIVAYRPYANKSISTSSSTNRPVASGNRPRMSPGDQAVISRDGNGWYVRRGQLTEILGGPLSRTIYSGRDGAVQTICREARVDAFGGSVRWSVDRPEADPDGHQKTQLDLKVKEYADARSYVARLQVGSGIDATVEGEVDGDLGVSGPAPSSVEAVSDPVVRLRVYADGDVEEADLEEVVSLCCDKTGSVELSLKGTLLVALRGGKQVTLTLEPDGSVHVVADGPITVESAGTITHVVGTLEVEQSAAKMMVGVGTAPVLYDAQFSSMLSAAVAEIAAIPGAPSTAALLALQSALMSGAFTSKKLTTE